MYTLNLLCQKNILEETMARYRLDSGEPTKVKGFKAVNSNMQTKSKNVPDGKSGTYKYKFQTYCDSTGSYSNSEYLRFDTFQDAKHYVMRNTPKGHQGLLDRESIFVN